MYQARILDRDRTLQAVLPDVRWLYARRINEATELSIHIPRHVVDEYIAQDHTLYDFFAPGQRENKVQYAEIASYVQIYQGHTLKASGKIKGRVLGGMIEIQAYTEEILLEASLTPAQYGKVWDGWDLADVARDLLEDWQSIRVKDQGQWLSYRVASKDVDLDTDPGLVMLAKRSNGRYYESGYITLAFGAGEIVNFKRWDRLRWSADSEDPVKTTIQYSTDGTNWSTEFDGGLPEEIGLVLSFGAQDTVYVRVNLYTNDTESEDPDGNPVGVTPTVFAIEMIARTESDLAAGSIPDVAGVTVKGITADHASALEVLLTACEQAGWEFAVWDGALNIAEAIGTDRTKDFALRAGTNMEITSFGDDDEELCNVLTAYGPGSGLNRLEVTLRDESSIAQYGEYPQAVEFDVETLTELQSKAQGYLDEHNIPTTNFEVFAAFDSEHEPEYELGDQVRVADPETGIVTTTRIMSETREYNESGVSVHLELGKAGLNLQSVMEDKGRPGKPVDPPTPTSVRARGLVQGLAVSCSAPKGAWAVTECHVSTITGFTLSAETLKGRGRQTRFDVMKLDPGVRYYARLIHVDNHNRRSMPSQEVSAVALSSEIDGQPPAIPTGLDATAYADTQSDGRLLAWVDLAWDAVTDAALREYHMQRRIAGGEWQSLAIITGIPGADGAYRDSAGLRVGYEYEYRVASAAALGYRSDWSAPASAAIPGDTTPPPKPTGLAGQFRHGDAIFSWDPCQAADYRRSKIEIVTSGAVKRTAYTSDNGYTYALEMNQTDHTTPALTVEIRVSHEDYSGNASEHTALEITHTPPVAPSQPTVTPMFAALWIEITPLASDEVVGYYVHITPSDGEGAPLDGAVTAKFRVGRVTTYAYQASPNSRFLVEVSAFDALCEGPKCAAVEAATLYLGVDALEPGSIKSEHIAIGAITEAQTNWVTHLMF